MRFRLFLAALVLSSALFAQSPAAKGGHPRLFFTADRVEALKARIATEKSSAEAWAAVLATADRAVEKPSDAGRAMEQLALAYRMTGDKRYAALVRDALRREIAKPNWGEADLLKRDPVWHAGLGLARSLYSAAVAFDSVHDALTPDERREIAKGIVDLGVLPTFNDWVLGGARIHSLDTMGHNWWSACVFVGGIGAMAVMDEEPRATAWLARVDAGSVEWFRYAGSLLENKPANFDRTGGFYESVNYASFAMSQYLLYRLAWTNALTTPPAAIPMLEHTGDYFMHVCYPNAGRMMTLNFGDGSINADGSRPLALLWANGWHDPNFAWYLSTTRQASYREGLDRTTPLGLMYFPTDSELARAPAAPNLPASTVFPDMGWATLRSSWDKNATLLGVRAGYTWNHSHADAGSFILFHRGENLLIDSGNCSYARPEYDDYYRQSRAHNVVLFNGEAENPEDLYHGSKFPGSISHLIESGDLKYVMADATGPTSKVFSRNYRHFLWVGDVILVIDDVESFVPGQFEFLLHPATKAERRGQDLTVTQNGASVIVRPLFPMPFPDAGLPTDYPEHLRLVEKTGLKDHEPDEKVTYYSFQPAEQTRRMKFITAITLVTEANKSNLPKLERFFSENYLGVRVKQGGTTTEVLLNLLADGRIRHRNANASLDGWETDAYLLALTHADGAVAADIDSSARLLVVDGSYLRRDGKVVLDSLSKVYLAAQHRDAAWDVQLQGQPVINALLRVATKPASVMLNGQAIAAPYDATTSAVSLTVRN